MANNQNPMRHPKRRLLELAGGVPYGPGSRLLAYVFGNLLLQRVLFGRRRRQLHRLRGLISCSGDTGRDLTRHLLGRYTIPWRVNALSRCDGPGFRSWVRIGNEKVIADMKAAGKPILLVSCHTAISRLVPLVVTRIGHDIATLEPEPYLQRMGARGSERIKSITLRGEGEKFWMKEMFQAKKVFDAKGIVHLALDGHQGTGGIPYAFLGRERLFQVGMARLAIQLGVPIILARATLEESGSVSIDFIGPLDVGDTELAEDARVMLFLSRYVEMIESVWRDDLGNVSPRHLPHYLNSEHLPEGTATMVSGRKAEAT